MSLQYCFWKEMQTLSSLLNANILKRKDGWNKLNYSCCCFAKHSCFLYCALPMLASPFPITTALKLFTLSFIQLVVMILWYSLLSIAVGIYYSIGTRMLIENLYYGITFSFETLHLLSLWTIASCITFSFHLVLVASTIWKRMCIFSIYILNYVLVASINE